MQLNIDEALRYLGAGAQAPAALRQEMADVARQLMQTLRPRYTYRVYPLRREEHAELLPDADVALTGGTARRMLAQCDQAVLLMCTLGAQFDTLLRTQQARDMSRAVMLDACGSAWVEAGCDAAEQELKTRFPERYLTDRFSPGYGDLPLTLQPGICAALDAQRRLGVTVTESLLLNPAKTVTAVIGLANAPQMARIRGCAYCALRQTCALRKGGTSCATG
ncbi:MAG: methionine synthase [Oscillospiraceae bacterium]